MLCSEGGVGLLWFNPDQQLSTMLVPPAVGRGEEWEG